MPALVALPVEAMLRKALIRTGKTAQTAGTLCEMRGLNFNTIYPKDNDTENHLYPELAFSTNNMIWNALQMPLTLPYKCASHLYT